MHPFDATTALSPGGEAVIDRRWWIVDGPYGGYVAAILARAALAVVDGARELRTLSVHFVAPPAAGPARVRAEVVRAGRSSTVVSLRMQQGDVVLALALVLLGAARETDAGLGWDDARMPAAPSPLRSPLYDGPRPPFAAQFEVRGVEHGPGVRNLAWLAHTPQRELDALSLVLFADTWLPAAMSHHGRLLVLPTYDLTVHLRAPLPAGERWLLAEFRSAQSVRGTWVEDGELWSEGGVLLAQSRQLAMLRGTV